MENMINYQQLNALNEYCNSVRELFHMIFKLKELRTRLEFLNVRELEDKDYKKSVETDHLSRDTMLAVFDAMDKLDELITDTFPLNGKNRKILEVMVKCIK